MAFNVLLLLLASCTGCDAQFTVTQPPSVSASAGETVKISCTSSSGSIGSYDVSWYQQKPSSAPKLLIYDEDYRASGISDRFSGSIDSSANAAILTISDVRAEDEQDYYCFFYYSINQRTMIQPHEEGNKVNLYKDLVYKEICGCNAQFTMDQPPSVSTALGETVQISCKRSSGSISDSYNSWYQQMPGPSFQQLQSLKSSETVSLGETITLSCKFSSGTISDGNYPRWAQQGLGKTPRVIIYNTSNRVPGMPDRFSGSRSGDTMSLAITGALGEDEADYYCAVWTGSGWHSCAFRWGNDITSLAITEALSEDETD
ncbi:immunoglobulin kappa light chain-like [Eublepharis macularius]|uniref:immunoglobulin kappa light chain-like n=1 Tax=Eublepharis macularius TaxID=481883 RepID=UPI00240F54F3|nr:immunoglobulin kappa light chain-like [Eublepharis macularius]